jgi:ankyrin repeat protein
MSEDYTLYFNYSSCLNVSDSSGRVPLHWASVAGHANVVQWIIEQDSTNVDTLDEARLENGGGPDLFKRCSVFMVNLALSAHLI